jgi:hypothetical protein
MCGGGTSQTSTVSIPPEVLENYRKVFARGEQISQKPFQEYSKDPNAFVAGMTPTQQAALENVNAVQGMASGDVGYGQGMIDTATGQGAQLQQESLGTGSEGQGIGSQLYGRSLGAADAGLGAAAQVYGQVMPQIGQAAATGQRYAGQAGDYLGGGTRNVGVGEFDTDKYMSPYLNQVVRATQALQAEENETQRSALKGNAIRAGAFGGDRAGVAQANLARQQSLANQSTLANLLQQGYTQAQGVAGQQQQLELGAEQANRAAQQYGAQQAAALGQQQYAQGLGSAQAMAAMGKDLYGMSNQQAQLQQAAAQGMFGQAAQMAALQQGAGNNMFNYGLQGGQGIANLGLANQQAQLQAAQAQMQAGQVQQQTDQAGKTALYNQFTQQQGFPYQQAQFLGNLAMGTGALSGSTTTTTGSGGGFFSDRRLKDNAEKIGETFDGQPIYRYNYKGENRTQIGLMAQDVEKHNPKAVGHSQGYKTLDYEKATDKAAERGHFYNGGLVPASMGGAVSLRDAYEGYARGGYAKGGYSKYLNEENQEMYRDEDGRILSPSEYTEMFGADDPIETEIAPYSPPETNRATTTNQADTGTTANTTTASDVDPYYMAPDTVNTGGYRQTTNEEGQTIYRDEDGRTLNESAYNETYGTPVVNNAVDTGTVAGTGTGAGGTNTVTKTAGTDTATTTGGTKTATTTTPAATTTTPAATTTTKTGTSKIDPRINALYQELLFRDAEPAGAEFWQQQLDKGASFEDIRSQFMKSREKNLVNQTPLTYDSSKFANYAAPVRNRYGSASAPAGSYGSSFQPQQASGKGPSYGQQMGGYQQPMNYGGYYGQSMGGYGGGYGGGFGGGYRGYQQPNQMSQFNQGYGQGYMGGYQPMQATGKGVGPSSYQSNYGYTNPSSMGAPNPGSYDAGASVPQASGKGASSSGSGSSGAGAQAFRNGGRIGYAAGGHIDPNDLAAIASQRMMELAPHAAGMPGQTMPGAQSYVSNKQLHVPKLITSNAQLPAQKNPFDQAISMAGKINSLGDAFSDEGLVGKGINKLKEYVPGAPTDVDAKTGKETPAAGGATPAPVKVSDAGITDNVQVAGLEDPDLPNLFTAARGGLVPHYANGGRSGYYLGGGALPYGGGAGGGGYIPEDILKPQQIQGLPKDNEQLKAAGAKATAGGSGGLGDVMKAGSLGYKLAPESLKASIKSMLPGAEAAAPATEAATGLGAAAPGAAEAAAAAAAPAAEVAGLGAAAAPAAEAAAALGSAALPAAEAGAALGTLGSVGSAVSSAVAPIAAAGAEGISALLAFLPFLSDRRAKENIEPIGKTYDGQTIYRYNYKGEPGTQIGLIAQEVEKHHKEAVGSSRGLKTVDYKRATEDAADRGHFYNGGVIPFRRGYADGMTVDEADLPAIGAQDAALPVGGFDLERAKNALSGIESGGRYEALGPVTKTGDRAYGKWQVMGANIPSWTEEATGERMTPQQFLRNKEAQEKVVEHQLTKSYNKYGSPEDAASVWFSGRPRDKAGNAQDILGTTVPAYIRKFSKAYYGEDTPRPPANIPSGAGPAADQAIAVARQPSAVAAPKKEGDGSFPIRPPSTAKGKEQDWSDFLTSKQFILPALTAIGTMGTTPTRNLGTALSAGLLGGVTSYQNLDKATIGQEQKSRELTTSERRVDLEDVTRRQARLTQLQQIAAGQARATGKVSPEVQQQIDELVKSLNISSSSQKISEAGKPEPTTTTGKVIEAKPEPGITQEPAKAATETAPSSGTQKALSLAEEAAKPIPTPSNPMEDKTFLSKLNPDSNPEEIRRRGQLAEAYSPGAAERAFTEALEVEKRMQERGYGLGLDGKQVDIPGWFEHKQAMLNAPEVMKFFNAQGAGQVARIEAREQLGGISRALEILQSGKYAEQKGEFQAALRSAGFNIPNTATMNAEAAQVATKDAMRSVFSRLAEIGGQPRVVEIQGLIQSGANVGLEPESNRKIISQSIASLDRADKFFSDALEERTRLGYKFNEPEFAAKWSKKEENASEKFRDEAYKNTAIRGAVPLDEYRVDTKKLIPGAVYIIEPGMGVKNVDGPTKMRWTGENFRSP